MDVDHGDGIARGKPAFNAVVAGFDAEDFARHLGNGDELALVGAGKGIDKGLGLRRRQPEALHAGQNPDAANFEHKADHQPVGFKQGEAL